MVYVLYTNISQPNHSLLLQWYLKYFPIEYQIKILSYRNWQDAQSSIIGRLLVQKGTALLGLQGSVLDKIGYNSYSKPFIYGSNIKFNISHSGDLVICAIGIENELGIDIEKVKSIDVSDFKPYMNKEELNLIETNQDSKVVFFEYWTQKEAVVKAIGKGLAVVPLKSFVVNDLTTQINGTFYYLEKIETWENYICYVCSDLKFLSQHFKVINFPNQDLF